MSSGPSLPIIKMILVGHSRVGKTSILLRYVDGTFSTSPYAGIGLDFKIKVMSVEEETFKLQIWEPGGGERFRSLAPSYYRGASVVLLVYDVNCKDSFDNLATFQEEMNKCIEYEHVLRVLIGNKVDLERLVERSEAEEYAMRHKMVYYECSAKSGDGVNDVFQSAVAGIVNSPGWREMFNSRRANQSNEEKNAICCCC